MIEKTARKYYQVILYVFLVVMVQVFLIAWVCHPNTVFVDDNTARTSSYTKIHFLNNPQTDAILLESNGKFAMIDGGTDESSGGNYVDYSKDVMNYLYSVGVNDTNLEFYLGTHPHTDHIANADIIINTFKPSRVYMSEYLERYHTDGKKHGITWKAYSDLIVTTQNTGAILIQNLNPTVPIIPVQPTSTPTTHDYSLDAKPVTNYTTITDHNYIYGYQDPHTTGNPVFQFGEAKIEIFNYSDFYKFTTSPDPNDWSWGVKVTAEGHSAFLGGDINNFYGSENYLSQVIGHVDLLKLGHHGHHGSNSYNYLKALSPSMTIATGSYTLGELQPDTKAALEELGASYISAKQGREEGLAANIAVFSPDGIQLTDSGVMASNSMYRLYNFYSGEHLFTKDGREKDYLTGMDGWDFEGISWRTPAISSVPVYRLYNSYSGEHLYTSDINEKDILSNLGWNFEGVGFYSDDNQRQAIYRLYNPYAAQVAQHLYTVDEHEYNILPDYGWQQEGIAFYGGG